MRRLVLLLMLLAMFMISGCGGKAGSAGLGAVGGAAIGAGGYEYHLKRQMNRVEEDFKEGRIDQREYEIRKDQIDRDSLIR
jgi:hypothetical protein